MLSHAIFPADVKTFHHSITFFAGHDALELREIAQIADVVKRVLLLGDVLDVCHDAMKFPLWPLVIFEIPARQEVGLRPVQIGTVVEVAVVSFDIKPETTAAAVVDMVAARVFARSRRPRHAASKAPWSSRHSLYTQHQRESMRSPSRPPPRIATGAAPATTPSGTSDTRSASSARVHHLRASRPRPARRHQ